MECDTHVAVLNRQRSRRVDRSRIEIFMRRLLEALPPEEDCELAVCLVSDRKMREFNRRYRHRAGPTDVLSFPSGNSQCEGGTRYLGDIAISVDTAARQARERSHSLDRELKVLALHGYLHLLGFDHERDSGEMMRLQRRLERRLLAPTAVPTRRKRS